MVSKVSSLSPPLVSGSAGFQSAGFWAAKSAAFVCCFLLEPSLARQAGRVLNNLACFSELGCEAGAHGDHGGRGP